MRYILVLLICVSTFQYTNAQDLKNSSKSFTVWQDDDQEALITMKVPESADITSSKEYVTYQEGKNSLTIDYTLEDDAELIVPRSVISGNIDLLIYAGGLPDKKIAGTSDFAISNKKIDGTIKAINGLSSVKITYDYIHTIVGANVTEKGKAVLYLLKTKGTSLVHTDEHQVIVCLKFDEQGDNTSSIDKVATAISSTITSKTE